MSLEANYDALVIGSGIAGFLSAVTLKKRRKTVAVLRRSGGATSLASGAWDFGAFPSEGPYHFEALRDSAHWKQARERLLVDKPELLTLGEAKGLCAEISQAFGDSLAMKFDLNRGFCLPTMAGRWKRVFGAQEIQSRSNLKSLEGHRIGVVASDHWRFNAENLCARWRADSVLLGCPLDISPLWVDVRMEGGDWPLPRVAARLHGDESFRQTFLSAIEQRLHGTHFDVLLFPPLFLDASFAEMLQNELHVTIAEVLGTGDPIAGQRLAQAIDLRLANLKIPCVTVGQLLPEIEGSQVKGLKLLEEKKGWSAITADNFVLASGKFFGGGVTVDFEQARESLFSLPLFTQRSAESVDKRAQIEGRARDFYEDPLWARLGLWVDSEWRPLNAARKPALSNVRACGSVLGGVDFAREGMGLGFMAYTGRQCVETL